MKISKKLLGISGLLVVVALIITSVSIVNFREDRREDRIDTGVKQQESAEVLIKQEDVSKREANVKHFLNEDGSYTAVTYDSPIHYKNGDVWEEIDNSLIVSSEYFENAKNPFKVQLPSQIDSDSPVTVSFGDYKLSFCFEGIQSASAEVKHVKSESELAKELQNNLSSTTDHQTRIKMQNEYKTTLTKNKSALSYTSVKPEMDLNYYISGAKLKEEIVLYSLPEETVISFDLKYIGMQAVLEEDNSVAFLNENGETIFTIDSPYMSDAEENSSTNIAVALQETETGCRYILTPDLEWLQSPERAWPVKIDPTTSQNSAYTHDNGIQQSDPTTVYKVNDRMYVGTYRSGSTSLGGWLYLKYTAGAWPTIPASGTVTKATMTLNYYPTASWQTANNMIVDVHLVTGSWSTDTITWNNRPAISSTYISSYNTGNKVGVTSGKDTFDVTKWVQNHYANPSADQGIALKPRALDSKTNRACYISSDYATTASRPITSITYVNKPDLQVSAVTVPTAYTKNINNETFSGGAYDELAALLSGNDLLKTIAGNVFDVSLHLSEDGSRCIVKVKVGEESVAGSFKASILNGLSNGPKTDSSVYVSFGNIDNDATDFEVTFYGYTHTELGDVVVEGGDDEEEESGEFDGVAGSDTVTDWYKQQSNTNTVLTDIAGGGVTIDQSAMSAERPYCYAPNLKGLEGLRLTFGNYHNKSGASVKPEQGSGKIGLFFSYVQNQFFYAACPTFILDTNTGDFSSGCCTDRGV